MGRGSAAAANKIAGVYAAGGARCASGAGGAAVLGKFSRRRGSRSLSGGAIGASSARSSVAGLVVQVQMRIGGKVPFSAVADPGVAPSPSHGWHKGEAFQGAGADRRLMGDLTDSTELERAEAAPGGVQGAPKTKAEAGGRPPRGRLLFPMGVARGGPAIHENRPTVSCLSKASEARRPHRVGEPGGLNSSFEIGVGGEAPVRPSTGGRCAGVGGGNAFEAHRTAMPLGMRVGPGSGTRVSCAAAPGDVKPLIPGSSNGRTPHFDCGNQGSTP